MSKKRLRPEDRKQEILSAALRVAARPGGWCKLTRAQVAQEAACAEGLVSRYFGTMLAFRRTIMRAAIGAEALAIVAQGLATGDPTANKSDPDLKARALSNLAG